MYTLNTEKMFFDIADGQAVVINFTNGMYYGTTLLGSAVLERLVDGADVDAVADAVGALPGAPDDIADAIRDFVGRAVEKEILVEGEGEPAGVEAIDPRAASEGFDLTLDEFAEVQDLILADPVHDVDIEEGWPIFKEE